jgi:uncharacterized RDD family membrane protein YckC
MQQESQHQFANYSQAATQFQPAGFWIRFLAILIDGIVMYVVSLPLHIVSGASTINVQSNPDALTGHVMTSLFFALIGMVLNYIYFAFFYSRYGGTPGKLLFGLRVVKVSDGTYLRWGRTAFREIFGKVIVNMFTLGLGYLLAAFRKDKRALHDLVAKTQVIRVK